MPLSLKCHPLTPVSSIDEITVEHCWEKNLLWLRYHAVGLIDELDLPDPVENPQRMNDLWKRTCCELFLREPGADRYCEFNFSVSRNWSAYQFSGYRDNMSILSISTQPEIYLDFSDTHFAVEVTLSLPDIWCSLTLDAGFSTIIADKNGDQSFWALDHPPGKPDFHHKDCFSHKLSAAKQI